MDTTIQVRKRGTITLPAELRERYKIKTGDTFRLVDLDGIFILTENAKKTISNPIDRLIRIF